MIKKVKKINDCGFDQRKPPLNVTKKCQPDFRLQIYKLPDESRNY